MKKYLRQIIFTCLVCLFIICAGATTADAQTTAQQLQGGDSKESAVEIQFNTNYEAIIPLNKKDGDYLGSCWYKFSLPQHTHHFALSISSENNNYSDVGIMVENAAYDQWTYGVKIDNRNTEYYVPDDNCDVIYLKAVAKSPETLEFKIVPIINAWSKENAPLNFNTEYKESFYMAYSSYYSFTAPYTGKYRIYYNVENNRQARYSFYYYTGQEVADKIITGKGSSIIELKAGVEYIACFAQNDTLDEAVFATYYISDQKVDSISIDEKDITLRKSEQYKLSPIVLPEKAVDTSVTYTTSNKKVALVTKDGCITAVGPGTATITIDSNDGRCKVTVPAVKVTRLDLSKNKLIIDKKGSYKIKATTYPTRADNRTVKFTSSNPKIVAVDKKTGKLTPKKAGTVTITCTTTDGSKISKKCKVIVKSSYFQKKASGKNYNSKITEKSVRRALGVPSNASVKISYGKKYYWSAGATYLVSVKIQGTGKYAGHFASATFDVSTGEIMTEIYMWT